MPCRRSATSNHMTANMVKPKDTSSTEERSSYGSAVLKPWSNGTLELGMIYRRLFERLEAVFFLSRLVRQTAPGSPPTAGSSRSLHRIDQTERAIRSQNQSTDQIKSVNQSKAINEQEKTITIKEPIDTKKSIKTGLREEQEVKPIDRPAHLIGEPTKSDQINQINNQLTDTVKRKTRSIYQRKLCIKQSTNA